MARTTPTAETHSRVTTTKEMKLATNSPNNGKQIGTDHAAGEASAENTSKNERARFMEEHKDGVTELHNFVVERNLLKEAEPLRDRINAGYDEIDQVGKIAVRIARDTGVLLHEWKAAVGHGNWVEAYESSGFKKSIDTARNWMNLCLLTDAEIEEIGSVREALRLLDEKKGKKGKGTGGKAGAGMDDDDDGDNADAVGDIMKKAMTPNADEGKAAPEKPAEPLTIMDELEATMKRACLIYSKEELAKAIASMLNDYYSTPPSEWGKQEETKQDASTFTPSAEWQEIPDGFVCPNGGEFRMNLQTGKAEGRWVPAKVYKENAPEVKEGDAPTAETVRFSEMAGCPLEKQAAMAERMASVYDRYTLHRTAGLTPLKAAIAVRDELPAFNLTRDEVKAIVEQWQAALDKQRKAGAKEKLEEEKEVTP